MKRRFQIFILIHFLVLMFVLPLAGMAAGNDSTYNPFTTIPTNSKERCDRLKKLLEIKIDNPEFAKTQPGSLYQGLPDYCTADSLLIEIIKKSLIFAGVIATIFIMYGGGMYLISAGNEERSEIAKKVLVNAVIGLVVIIMAFTIVKITVNTIASPKSGSSTGTENSVSAGDGSSSGRATSGGNTDTSGGAENASSSALSADISKIHNSIGIGNINYGKANISIIVKHRDWDSLNNICTGSPTMPQSVNASLSVKVAGSPAGFFKLTKAGASYMGSANVTASPGQSIEVSVCNAVVYKGAFK